MVARVQRRRGLYGWAKAYRHLPWPSDVTQEQKNVWFEQYSALKLKPPKRNSGIADKTT